MMRVMAESRIEFTPDGWFRIRARMLDAVLASLGVLIVAAVGLLYVGQAYPCVTGPGIVWALSGRCGVAPLAIGSVLLLAAAIWAIRMSRVSTTRGIVLTTNPLGIWAIGWPVDLLPWNEIERIEVFNRDVGEGQVVSLGIHLKDVDSWRRRLGRLAGWNAGRLVLPPPGGPVWSVEMTYLAHLIGRNIPRLQVKLDPAEMAARDVLFRPEFLAAELRAKHGARAAEVAREHARKAKDDVDMPRHAAWTKIADVLAKPVP